MKILLFLLVLFSFLGIVDVGYLTYEQLAGIIPPCSAGDFADCGKVLTSEYSKLFGIPLAFIGLSHYIFETILICITVINNNAISKKLVLLFTFIGGVSSIYFVYLQLFVIGAICLYCMFSAVISFSLFVISQKLFSQERKELCVSGCKIYYKHVGKRLLFLQNPEVVHHRMTSFGEFLGKHNALKKVFSFLLFSVNKNLSQTFYGVNFSSPIGLAAGFDYEAKLTQILPSLGFGFQSLGTITYSMYEGNPSPMLGRLPKSKSLMVNKGFKNLGAKKTIAKLEGLVFTTPVGISIGKTNILSLRTQRHSISDIVKTFRLFENSRVKHSYYELNISCPNLKGSITFYPPKNLDELLTAIDKLNLRRPVFVKMPIEKTNKEFMNMLHVIAKHSPAGVIIGNLQKDRNDKSFDKIEVANFPIGNFSGKPCFNRSNELISLCYKRYKNRFIIVGCGGVFSPEDAYEKIKRGASLVQLITGMIYEGPQLVADINLKLPKLIVKDGYNHISEAVGTYSRR